MSQLLFIAILWGHQYMLNDIHQYMLNDIHQYMLNDIHQYMLNDIHQYMPNDIHSISTKPHQIVSGTIQCHYNISV